MATIDTLKKIRLDKLDVLKNQGINPYPATARRDQRISDARQSPKKEVAVAGRIRGLRGHGKIMFADFADESAKIQLVFKSDLVHEHAFKLLPNLDIGDFLSVQGTVDTTQAGEISIFVADFQIISKSLRPLPDEWYGLKDVEERYRRRHLDLLLNPDVKATLDKRWKIEQAIRTFLWGEGYTEVETPILQPLYGGTNAKPFTTHLNALDVNFYLRIAPELYLKRLIVGGYERIFEIARNFRNEGMDATHQPEFTMMEFYEAYADYHRIMDLTEDLIKHAAQAANQSYMITIDGKSIDISGKWRRITVDEALKEYAGIDWQKISEEEIKARLEKAGVQVTGEWSRDKALFALYDHFVTPKLIEPTWVIDYPRAVSPLSKEHRTKEGRVERFEGYVGGKEICDGWSEINSGLEQRSRFEQEQRNMKAGDAEAQPLDEDFIQSLEYGMPPLGGIGIGIDRLVMLITNTWMIREVIPFPLMRPESISGTVAAVSLKKGEDKDTSVSKKVAMDLLHEHTKNENLRRHMYAVGYAMRALAEKLGGDSDTWEVMGLLHDADWEKTKDAPHEHTKLTLSWLAEKGIREGRLVHALMSHNRKHTDLAELEGLMEWALETVDELTGFIVAVTLMRPEKKLESVDVGAVMKKWKMKAFAAAVDRDQIAQCEEKLGIPLEEFITITLTAMQQHHEELGL